MYYKTQAEAQAAEARLQGRGATLAPLVQPHGDGKYLVPSSDPAHPDPYTVNMRLEVCDCLYFAVLNQDRDPHTLPIRCKHLWSVVYWKQQNKE